MEPIEEGHLGSGELAQTPSRLRFAELLELLADAEERVEAARSSLEDSETRAERHAAEAETLRQEIGLMTDALVELDRRLDGALSQLDVAQSRLQDQEGQLAHTAQDLEAARQSAQGFQKELEGIHKSTAWKVLRSLQKGRAGSASPVDRYRDD